MRWLLLVVPLVGCDVLLGGTLGLDAQSHPCTGNRTDTVWMDDAQTAWVGCGSTAVGTGLYTSTNGGQRWSEVTGFETFRVSSISRASDGLLYIAGIDTESDRRVLSWDGAVVGEVLTADRKHQALSPTHSTARLDPPPRFARARRRS